jgi:hypothetical protein
VQHTRVIVFALVALIALGSAIALAGENRNFVAPLSGGQEVPPVDTNATGVAKFKLNKAGDELGFKVNVANIEDVTQAHIHCGPAGVNGPVVAFLYGFGPTVSPNGTLAEGTITDADIIPRPDSPACPGGVADLDDLIDKMNTGGAYANVHTVANPGSEIRGQIK